MSTISSNQTKRKYVGITGFVSCGDVDLVGELIEMLPKSRRLMAGILVSAKTLRGESPTRNRYIYIDRLDSMTYFLRSDGAWPVVHFNTRASGSELVEELSRIMNIAPATQGIQLNIVDPDIAAMEAFKALHPDVELILQMGHTALKNGAAIDYARQYATVADHALFDLSGGVGKPLDLVHARAVAASWDIEAALGLAGGLDAESVGGLAGLDVSCDSETRLRDDKDRLDHNKARAYVLAASRIR